MKKKDKIDQQEGQMSYSEKLKKEEKDESASYGSVTTSGIKGIQFPISEDAIQNLKLIGENKIDCLIIKIENEKFEVDFAGQCDISEIHTKLTKTEPRFIFFNYNHNFEEKDLCVFYFIYCCPTESKVKERMKYSSSKSATVSYGTENGIVFKNAPNIEVSDVSDLTKDYLHNYIHPVKVEEVVFKKPAKPGRKPGNK